MSKRRLRVNHSTAVAYLALFVALGGSAYAAARIDGRLIVNRSIPGNRLQRHTVGVQELKSRLGVTVRRALIADRAADVHLAGEAAAAQPRARIASAAGSSSSTGGLVGLMAGQSETLFSAGPFTLSGGCTADLSGGFRTVVDATSSVAGWVKTGDPTPKPAGVPVQIDDESASTPQFAPGPGVVLAAPGSSVSLAPISLGENVLDFDCVIDAVAIGS